MIPLVSVIITTWGRPRLVGRAVASALGQTVKDVEVIVVMDGPDPATHEILKSIEDARLRVQVREVRGGQASAINAGIQLARAAWTAMLDDDDEWMPQKLETQLRTAESSSYRSPVIGCRFLARSERGEVLWPLRTPRRDEPICEYLFCRSRLAFGEGIQPTSMWLAPTELFRRHPMNETLPNHCDLDWLVRVDQEPGVGLEIPGERSPLAIWQMQGGRDRCSNVHDWRATHHWIKSLAQSVTPRAFAGFLLTWVSFSARSQRDFRAFPFLLRESFRHGRPGVLDLVVYVVVWALPPDLRARLSHSFSTRTKVA